MTEAGPERLVGPLASTGFWLKVAAQAWQRELDRSLRDLDLTTAQFSVLASAGWLGRATPPTQQQVADFSGTDRMLTSKLVALLEERGLVERVPDPQDGRARRVVVTLAGRALITESSRRARGVDAAMFGSDVEVRDALRDQFGHLAGLAPPIRQVEVSGSGRVSRTST